MSKMMGIIYSGGRKDEMGSLVAKRSVAAIPVGGKYRAIDFVLSNMVNSGIDKVGLVTQFSFHSLMDHLGSGREWDLDRRNGGLFIFPPYLGADASGWYRGSADGMYANMSFLRRSHERYVVVATGNCVYNFDFNQLKAAHIESGADITIMVRDMSDLPQEELKNFGMVKMEEDGCISDFREKSNIVQGNMGSMGVYIMERTLLMELLEDCHAHGGTNFVLDILVENLDRLNIRGYVYDGYWRSLSSVGMFFNTNMEMVDPQVQHELFESNGKIFTKVKDTTPTKYNDEAEVSNSIISDGCIIEGTVVNSVLSRSVKVGRGAYIKNCVIMQDSVIGSDTHLENVVLDKEVTVTDGKHLKGDDRYPMIVAKKAVI